MASTQTLLDQVDTAITSILNGDAVQEYQIGNRRYKAADLKTLFAVRRDLQQQLAMETNNPVRVGKLGRARGVDR